MTDNNELLTRLEAATEGSRELDAEIALSTRFPDYQFPNPVLNRKPRDHFEAFERITWDGGESGDRPAHYTTSIDAAMTLVPQWCGSIATRTRRGELADVTLYGHSSGVPFWSKAYTLALALCIAALKARQGDCNG